jgi:hypothetical protein
MCHGGASFRPTNENGRILSNQQALQKVGMQMAVKMFAPAKSGGE